MSTALAIQRTPALIAAEINNIKDQTKFILLNNSIEIGRRLCEAKELMPHGEWGKWLEASIDYSQSTANNLMRIFEEYGADQIALFGETGAKSQALGKLSYTQAVALLAIPGEEREEFVQKNDIEKLSTRELQKVIKERDQALKQKEQAEKELADKTAEAQKLKGDLKNAQEKAEQDLKNLQTSIDEKEQQLKEAQEKGDTEEIDRLKSELEEADAQLASANDEIAELNRQLNEKPIDVPAAPVVEKIPEEVEKELADLRKDKKSAAALKYSVYFNNLVSGFNDLLTSLAEIKETDPEKHEKYSHATLELISQMSARV